MTWFAAGGGAALVSAASVSPRVLRAFLAIQAALVLAALLTVAIHAVWLWRRSRWDRPRLTTARRVLAATVEGDGQLDQGIAELQRVPRRVQQRVVEQLAVSLIGAEGRRIGAVAESLGLVRAAQRRCASRWWWRRLVGAHQLNVYGRGETLPSLFDDPHPAVRAQVIEWAGDNATSQGDDMAGRLVSALQDPSPLCRYTAADSLLRAGAGVIDTLAAELETRSGKELADLLGVLARRPDPRYHLAANSAGGDPSPAVRAAAAEMLGGIGGTDATAVLPSLLRDVDPDVRVAAADALRRLGSRESAADLAPLLRDPSFAVRQAAAAALVALGPGGVLLLRHYASDDDRYAADMARSALASAERRGSRTGEPG